MPTKQGEERPTGDDSKVKEEETSNQVEDEKKSRDVDFYEK